MEYKKLLSLQVGVILNENNYLLCNLHSTNSGITGQDGSYLAELLISKGYEVHGIIRRSSSFNTGRIQHLYKDPVIHKEGCKWRFFIFICLKTKFFQ